MRIARISKNEKEVQQSEVDLSLMDAVIEKYKNIKGNMIPLLQNTQELYGYIPREAFKKLERETSLKLSDMYGVASFYAQFRLKPVGKVIIKVCHGTACHVQNATAITDALEEELGVKDGETTADHIFTLESVACLGCCSLAPVMMIGENTYGKLTGKHAKEVIREIREKETGSNCSH
ncbi:MAG TPA: NADH-quinone oxidoreductase subunit NuoE [Bacteroidales bacterium]|nr:NADH-quinone oxidoreductase subunit NuoE [Bacteroidales bacterium]